MTDPIGLNHPFNAYVVEADGSKGQFVGGSYDDISAVTVASAVYQAKQQTSPNVPFAIGVFDSTDALIAWVGTATV